MKNLLIWINPEEKFDEEHSRLANIQIENSLDLGWSSRDIILVTNFPYKNRGINVVQVPNSCYNSIFRQATKVDTMVYLFKNGFFDKGFSTSYGIPDIPDKDEIYWLHDFDAYQQFPITREELGLENVDIGLTDYGRNTRWNGGSMFIKKEIRDFYIHVYETMYRENENYTGIWKNEEDVLMKLTDENYNNINDRIKRLNISYNFGIKRMKECYEKSLHKPPKVLHFHPERKYRGWGRAFDIVCGNNELGHPIMTDRLIKIFEKHGIARTN